MSEANTEALEFACKRCGSTKPHTEFPRHKQREFGIDISSCRSCRRIYMQKRIKSGRHKLDKRAAIYRSYGLSQEEAKRKALEGPQRPIQLTRAWKNHPDDFASHDKIVRQNAVQAWRYWFTEKASKEWLDGYYAKQPWKDHRISEAESFRLQYKHDPEFCLQERMRSHMRRQRRKDKIGDIMRDALKRQSKGSAVERLLGYTVAELRAHLEKQFTKRMNWKRFADGDIHIDHIIPISSFNFENVGDPEWKACWALTNLRPLWAKDNLAKRNKIVSLL